MDRRVSYSVLISLCCIVLTVFNSVEAKPKSKRTQRPSMNAPLPLDPEQVQAFAAYMATTHQWAIDETRTLLNQAQRLPDVEKLILPVAPGKPRSWQAYRARFIEPVRVQGGLAFWQQHASWLERAHNEFGVPEEIIVAILGIETIYGRQQGNYRVIDVLTTLGFHFPREAPRDRAPFFRAQLEAFLLYTRRNQLSATDIRGSFAGAIGIPQFMPSSITQFALDFDHDGVIDLRTSVPDAIGSVGAFLLNHGWQRELAWDFPLSVRENSDASAWLAHDLRAKHNANQLAQAGFEVATPLPVDYPLGLINLESPDSATEYRAATLNFFAITQYNRSFFYAAAVVDLARVLRARYDSIHRKP